MKRKGHDDWAGIFPASLTMFDAAGNLDERGTATHIERLLDEGAHGIVVAGTSGEFIVLDPAERVRLIEVAVAVVHGRVPVIAGTGHSSTAETIRLTKRAAQIGADGAIVILPYYMRPTPAEVMEHFRAVGRETSIPIMIYNNPANSAAPALEAHQIRDLYEGGYAQALKSTFPTVHQIHEVVAETDAGFRVFYGSFMAPLEGMAGGAHGWISGILNVVTPDAVAMWNAMETGDLKAARVAWQRILPIKRLYTRELLGTVSDLAIYRAMLRLRGYEGGYCRAPLRDLSADQFARLAAMLNRDGVISVGADSVGS